MTTCGWSPSLRIASASRRARAWIDGADALGVEERDRDLGAGGGVVGQVDALAPALAEEAPHAVAAGDLGGDVGGQLLGPGLGGDAAAAVSSVPHESQNRAPSRFSLPQDGHRMPTDYPSRHRAARVASTATVTANRLPGRPRRGRRDDRPGLRTADPLWSWMFPDPARRAEQHAAIFGLYVESALPEPKRLDERRTRPPRSPSSRPPGERGADRGAPRRGSSRS